jgi:hypothetical protein
MWGQHFADSVEYRPNIGQEATELGLLSGSLVFEWWLRTLLRRMVFSGMLGRVALVRTDILEELRASLIRVTRIGELGTTLAVTSNRRMLRRNTK